MAAVLPEAAVGQSVTGDMQGVVLTEEGSPLAAAPVTARAGGVRERVAMTDETGAFRMLGLPPGSYTISIDYIGRVPVRLEAQPVRIGQTTSLGRIVMNVRPVGVEGITISAQRPLIDPMTTAHGSNLTRSTFENLPVERDYLTITTLAPHAVLSPLGDGINIGGATGLENQYYVDGVNVTDPMLAGAGARLPYNFVKEIEVRTGGYEAEFRGALGGVVNAVTQSGQNELQVESFGFFSGKQFSSGVHQALFDRKRTDYSQFDFGAAVSGAAVQDRLWFFASYNPLVEHEQISVSGLGSLEDHSVTHRYAGKLSWQPTPRTRLVLTSVGDPSRSNDVGNTGGLVLSGPITNFVDPDALLGRGRAGTSTLSLRATHVRDEKFLWEGWIDRTAFHGSLEPHTAAANEPYFIDDSEPTSRSVSGGLPVHYDNSSRRTSAALRFTWVTGPHTFKVGADVMGARLEQQQFEESVTKLADGFERYSAQFVGTVRSRATGAFIQDSWQISDRLRFNPGIRWNQERFWGADNQLAMKLDNEIQPRAGLIFQPGNLGTHKVSASYGRFYEDLLTTASSLYHAYGSFMLVEGFPQDPRGSNAAGEKWWGLEPAPGSVLELSGLYYDEFTLGYERALSSRTKASVRVIRRNLGEAIEDVFDEANDTWVLGNPGRDELAFAPRAKREYTALELGVESSIGSAARFFGSYVWSRNYGNYPGWYNSDYGYVFPNVNGSFDDPEFERNNPGLLPNDRPHVLKLAGWYKPGPRGMTLGTFVLWQSGTPLSEMGRKDGRDVFVGGRGALGRTPSLLDVNARVSYVLPLTRPQFGAPTVLIDVFHIGSKQSAAAFDQKHYRDEAQTDVNPTYMMPTQYFPPMSVRVGLQMTF